MASGGRFALIDDEDNESNPSVLLARAPVKVVPVVEVPVVGETSTPEHCCLAPPVRQHFPNLTPKVLITLQSPSPPQ